jgi:Na+/H+-translocating membrane pyrophosphatase
MLVLLLLNGASLRAGEADSYQKLRQIYRDIQNGAKAFLAAEYRMCVAFIVVFGFAMIFFVARVDGGWDFKVGTLTAFSFVVGAVTSMVSGYLGMMIAVFTNARCTMCATLTPEATAWRESFNSAFRGGAVMGFALSGLGLIVMYFLMCLYVSAFDVATEAVKLFECVAGFGLGGSSIAMFGRVGGGIYTKVRGAVQVH